MPPRARWTEPADPAPAAPAATAPDPLATVLAGGALARGSGLRAARWTSARCTFELACDEATLGGDAEPFARVRFDVAWEFPEPVR
ncbi:MAG: hypothetical protein IPJ77_03770 [Planctomycetes bacterium]|nr:hypothetical protein [Planctomycetota bacterium]